MCVRLLQFLLLMGIAISTFATTACGDPGALYIGNSRESLSVHEEKGSTESSKRLFLGISLSDAAHIEYFTLKAPSRFVIDIHDQQVRFEPSVTQVVLPEMGQIRFGKHPDRFRIVVDLSNSAHEPLVYSDGTATSVNFRLVVPDSTLPDLASRARLDSLNPDFDRGDGLLEIEREDDQTDRQSELEQSFRVGEREGVLAPGILRNSESGGEEVLKQGLKEVLSDQTKKLPVELSSDHIRLQPYRRRALTVHNTGEEALSLSTYLAKVEAAGTKKEQISPTSDIVLSPEHLSLQPGERKSLLLLTSQVALAEERVYFLHLIEDDPQAEPLASSLSSGIRLPVLVPPQRLAESLSWSRKGNIISLKNEGNLSLLLAEGSYCSPAEECSPISSFRIYPGNKIGIEMPASYTVSFVKRHSGKETALMINPE